MPPATCSATSRWRCSRSSANNGEQRFRDVDEMTGAVLRFPGERWPRSSPASARPTSRVTTIRRAPRASARRQALRIRGGDRADADDRRAHDQADVPEADQFAAELLLLLRLHRSDKSRSRRGGRPDRRGDHPALYRSADTPSRSSTRDRRDGATDDEAGDPAPGGRAEAGAGSFVEPARRVSGRGV